MPAASSSQVKLNGYVRSWPRSTTRGNERERTREAVGEKGQRGVFVIREEKF